jgi:arabinofuranan 3-O-arabinosyltransferase
MIALPATASESAAKAGYRRRLIAGLLGALLVGVALSAVAPVTTSDLAVMLDSARWVREGIDPYQAPIRAGAGYNLNSPPALALFLPLSYLSDQAAFAVWTALSVFGFLLALGWIARELAGELRRDDMFVIAIATALMTSQGVATSLVLGQTTGLLTVLMTAGWIADRHGRDRAAGLMLGIAIVLKPFLGVFAVYALWRRSRPMITGLVVGATVTAVVGLLIDGVAGYVSWIHALNQVTWIPHRLNGSLLALFSRTLSDTSWMFHATPIFHVPALIRPLWFMSVAIVAVGSAITLVRAADLDRSWVALCLASLLISPLGWEYYVPIVVGPIVALTGKTSSIGRWLLACGALCSLVPIVLVDKMPWAVGAVVSSTASWSLLLLFAGAVYV